MDEETIEGIINSLVEDYTWEELHDVESIKKNLEALIGVEPEYVIPLLFGAIQVKRLRDDNPVFWQEILKHRTQRH